jgi:hypothetical protein
VKESACWSSIAPTAHTSFVARTTAPVRALYEPNISGEGTTDHTDPSHCSISGVASTPSPASPTAHTSPDGDNVTAWRKL